MLKFVLPVAALLAFATPALAQYSATCMYATGCASSETQSNYNARAIDNAYQQERLQQSFQEQRDQIENDRGYREATQPQWGNR